MFARVDRREWAVLGLVALAWALLAAPLLHRAAHLQGHGHRHAGDVPSAPHGQGSLEHQLAVFAGPSVALAPPLVVWRVVAPLTRRPAQVVLVARRPVARAQAP